MRRCLVSPAAKEDSPAPLSFSVRKGPTPSRPKFRVHRGRELPEIDSDVLHALLAPYWDIHRLGELGAQHATSFGRAGGMQESMSISKRWRHLTKKARKDDR